MTLQNRITTLMIISSIVFISVFAFIQLNNQIENINNDNLYRSNLSSGVVKDDLEAYLKQNPGPQSTLAYLQEELNDYQKADLIKNAFIFTPDGKIIASTRDSELNQAASYRDLNKLAQLESSPKENWLLPDIDRAKLALVSYIALRITPDGPISCVARLSFPLANIQDALADVYRPVILVAFLVILANIILGYFLSKTVIGPIKVLDTVTKSIAAGDLSIRTRMNTNDELEELGKTFNYMTEQLVIMKERAENANPLTKLPGNIVIQEEVEKRIKKQQKFVVIYCDLDNFKAFNDKYGIAKGDEAIKLTAEVFKESAKNKGNPDDFIGHEGGDDFILLATPDKAQGIADYITAEFDKRVRSLYSQEDLAQGHIISHARDGSIKKFPIMTISLAGVSNEDRPISSYGEVTNIAAEVKKKAKAIESSVFVMDKRKTVRLNS
ncbi:MAG: GGDEF domain-containing protein [Candidatus Omnitrophica bacterium]|nr:GGDEF domain-containing protein [Candidatus Omnitrophota bacterium]